MTRGEEAHRAGGPWIFGGAGGEETGSHAVAGGVAAVWTASRPETDGENEDAAVVIAGPDATAVLAIADGFGGAPAGERASRLAISELAREVSAASAPGASSRAAVLDGFEAANRAILELGVGAATTLAAISVTPGGAVRAFHSGDSAILVIGGRGKIKWRTVAHSPAGYAVASGWVDESEARGHDEAQVVSNYLGSSEMRIEIGPELRLARLDTVLLASDGLTDNLSVEEISAAMAGSDGLDHLLAGLAEQARERMASGHGKPDDLTILGYRTSRPGAAG